MPMALNILKVAAVALEVDALALDIRDGQIIDTRTGEIRMPLSELDASPTSAPTRCPRISSRS